jgi:hypothetical protein
MDRDPSTDNGQANTGQTNTTLTNPHTPQMVTVSPIARPTADKNALAAEHLINTSIMHDSLNAMHIPLALQ